jgi:siroheme synthase
MSRLAEITAALMVGGVSPELPVALVRNATTPEQHVLVSTLARVCADTAAQGVGAPTIIAIGEMIRIREALIPFSITMPGEP